MSFKKGDLVKHRSTNRQGLIHLIITETNSTSYEGITVAPPQRSKWMFTKQHQMAFSNLTLLDRDNV